MAVLGVDACRDGWVGVRLDDAVEVFCAATIEALVDRAGALDVVAIDIPIGLPADGARQADLLTRKAVGPRRASVFVTPPRPAPEANTHAEGTGRCREICGYGLSRQAYALGPKILEVDAWQASAAMRVVEVHPELSFATLAEGHLRDPKNTWAGFEHRRRLLAEAGIVLDGELGLTGCRVGPDDVLDAAIAAWTATRVALGEHVTLPDPPQELPDGNRAAIHA